MLCAPWPVLLRNSGRVTDVQTLSEVLRWALVRRCCLSRTVRYEKMCSLFALVLPKQIITIASDDDFLHQLM